MAELTIAKMLDIARHTIPACYDVKVNKTWDKYKFVGSELRGKTLGVLASAASASAWASWPAPSTRCRGG